MFTLILLLNIGFLLLLTQQVECDSLKKELDDARKQLEEATKKAKSKDDEISRLKSKLNAAESSMATALSEFGTGKAEFEREKIGLESQIQELKIELTESKKKADLFTALSTKLVDPGTNEQFRCPVFQNNGIIRSLGEIISIWVKDSSIGQCSVFRLFQCPILQNFTTISNLPIVDAFLKVAEVSGIDVSMPISIWFKDSGGKFIEFSFNEKLELIARLCSAYNRRIEASGPPEQRSVSVSGKSFIISMRFQKKQDSDSKYLLECFGISNDGSGKVDINVKLASGWVHPFIDADIS